jgi:hypothetical protein
MNPKPQYRFLHETPGFCQVHYRCRKTGRYYCIQNDGSGWTGEDKFVFYICSRDGEPSNEVPFPPAETFDKLIYPASLTNLRKPKVEPERDEYGRTAQDRYDDDCIEQGYPTYDFPEP